MSVMTPITPSPTDPATRRRALAAMHAFVRLDAGQQQQFINLMAAAAPPPAPLPADDARACLAHLLSWPLFAAPGAPGAPAIRTGGYAAGATIADALVVAAAHPDGAIARALLEHGIRWAGPELEVEVALWHQPILRVFSNTPWERCWIGLMRGLPGARVTTMTTFRDLRSKAVAIPAAALDLSAAHPQPETTA